MASPVGGGGGFFGGLDIETIVRALVDAQRAPVIQSQARIREMKARITAFGEVSSAIAKLDGVKATSLSASSLQAQVARSSDETRLVTTASGSAAIGQHDLTITKLAQADRHRTQTYDDRNSSPIGHGTLEFTVDGKKTTVTVDDTNDTLQGVMDAINADVNGGARASIVADGSGDVLVLASRTTGAASNVVFDQNTTDLAFTETLAAQDANFTLDGITITDASNRVTKALEGVTLDLRKADPDTNVSFEVTTDTQRVEDSVRAFVDSFNAALSTIERVGSVDTSGKQAGGALAGDSSLRSMKADLISSVTGRVTPPDGQSYDLLAEVGVTFTRTGRLQLDASKLKEQVAEDPKRVANLFVTRGTASANSFRFVASSARSEAGTYAVNVTTAAEQATLLGDNAVDPGGLAQDETLTIALGGTSAVVDLLAGDDDATVVQKVNDALGDAGINALAESSGGRIRLTSVAFGSTQQVAVRSSVGSILGSVGFDLADRTDDGVDVAGTLGGLAATGQGQVLKGGADTAVDGILVAVTSSGTGNLGDLTFRVGLAEKLDRSVNRATSRNGGRIPPQTDNLQVQVRRQEERIVRLEATLADRADTLRRKFTAAQQTLSALQAMQGSLGSLR